MVNMASQPSEEFEAVDKDAHRSKLGDDDPGVSYGYLSSCLTPPPKDFTADNTLGEIAYDNNDTLDWLKSVAHFIDYYGDRPIDYNFLVTSGSSRSLHRWLISIIYDIQRTVSKREHTPATVVSKIVTEKIWNRRSQNREPISSNSSEATGISEGRKRPSVKHLRRKKHENRKLEDVSWMTNDNPAQNLDQLNHFQPKEHQFLSLAHNFSQDNCLLYEKISNINQETEGDTEGDTNSLVEFADDSGDDLEDIPSFDTPRTQREDDIAECITSSLVETEDRTVKFSTSGEDTSEDTGEDAGEEASFKKNEDVVDEEDTADEKDNVGAENAVNEEDTVQGGDPLKYTVSDVIPVLESNCTFNGKGGDDGAEGRKSEEGDAIDTDVAECITSSQVESEDRIVKFSTSGGDSGEAVEEDSGEDVEEDKKKYNDETDVVEDSVEDAPTFANVLASNGSDGGSDKSDENDRDKNSRECEKEETMYTASLGPRRSLFHLFPAISSAKTDHAESWKIISLLDRKSISSSSREATGTYKFKKKIAQFFRQQKLTRSRQKCTSRMDVVDDNLICSDADVNRNSLCDNLSVMSNQPPDVPEYITISQVETEDRTVKLSTSGEDTGEDVEEDKENNINETDVVEDSVEDAPTFANVSTSSGSDGDDDKDDKNDRDKNSRECEQENAPDTGDTRDVVEGRKRNGECEENCSINTDDNTCGTTNESMCKVDRNYGGVGGSGGDGGGDGNDGGDDDDSDDDDSDDDGDENIEAESVEDEEDVDEKADTNDEEIAPSDNNETDKSQQEMLAQLQIPGDWILEQRAQWLMLPAQLLEQRAQLLEQLAQRLEQLAQRLDQMAQLWMENAQRLDQMAQLMEENAQPQEVTLTSRNYVVSGTPKLWILYEVEINVKQSQLRELEPLVPLLRERTMFKSFAVNYLIAILQYCFGELLERELLQRRLADTLRFIRHIAFLIVMLRSILVFLCSVQRMQTPRGKSHRNNSSSKLGLPPKPNNHNWDGYSGYDNGNAIWMRNRKSDSDTTTKELAVTPITELYQKQETDEWEVILKHLRTDYTYLRPANTDFLCYTIPRYPDNHNPLLPLALQKKLDEMTPREYLTYVLRELTLEERESLMVDERQRRKTFLVNWPRENNLSGVKMALAGFYCVDDYDRVQCVFCRGSLHKWESSDNPMTEHARSFNFCRFVKGLECGNREYKNDVLSPEELKNISFFGTPEMKKNRDGSVSTDSRTFGISTNKADTIQYAPEPTRRKTFARWPASSALTPQQLGEAGFYFTGFDDQVRCFYCSGGLREWKSNDDPWEEHARWFPECSFLVQQKGEEFVNEVHAKTPANKKCTRSTVSQKKAEKDQIQQLTNHQVMVEFCRKMGHSDFVIKETIRRNGGQPFEEADQLVEAIYSLDDDYIDSGFQDGDEVDYPLTTAGWSGGACALPKVTDKLVSVPEEDARKQRQDIVTDGQPGLMDGGAYRKSPPGCCIVCYRKAGLSVDASQIALPCGHVVYCERCGKDEKQKVDRTPTYKPRCPYLGCGGLMTGTFKMFLN